MEFCTCSNLETSFSDQDKYFISDDENYKTKNDVIKRINEVKRAFSDDQIGNVCDNFIIVGNYICCNLQIKDNIPSTLDMIVEFDLLNTLFLGFEQKKSAFFLKLSLEMFGRIFSLDVQHSVMDIDFKKEMELIDRFFSFLFDDTCGFERALPEFTLYNIRLCALENIKYLFSTNNDLMIDFQEKYMPMLMDYLLECNDVRSGYLIFDIVKNFTYLCYHFVTDLGELLNILFNSFNNEYFEYHCLYALSNILTFEDSQENIDLVVRFSIDNIIEKINALDPKHINEKKICKYIIYQLVDKSLPDLTHSIFEKVDWDKYISELTSSRCKEISVFIITCIHDMLKNGVFNYISKTCFYDSLLDHIKNNTSIVRYQGIFCLVDMLEYLTTECIIKTVQDTALISTVVNSFDIKNKEYVLYLLTFLSTIFSSLNNSESQKSLFLSMMNSGFVDILDEIQQESMHKDVISNLNELYTKFDNFNMHLPGRDSFRPSNIS